MRDLLALVVANVRRRWREWRDGRALAGEALVVELGRWSEVLPSSCDDGRSRVGRQENARPAARR